MTYSSAKSIRMHFFSLVLLVPTLGATGGCGASDADMVSDLTGTWEYRKGLFPHGKDSANSGAGGTAWRPVRLPNRLHRFVPELRDHRGWVTLRRVLTRRQSRLLRSGRPVSYFSGNIGDVARFFLNGREIGKLGSVRPYSAAYSRFLMAQLPALTKSADSSTNTSQTTPVRDVLVVSLYTNGTYPLWHNERMFMGPTWAVYLRFYRGAIVRFALVSIYVMMGLFCVAIWLGQPKERYFLYFGLFAILYSIFWVFASDTRDLLFYDWLFLRRKIELAALTAMIPPMIYFIESYFKSAPSPWARIYAGLCAFLIACTIAAWKPQILQYLRIIWQLMTLLMIAYVIYFLSRHMLHSRWSTVVFALITILFAFAGVYDIATALGVFNSGFVGPYSFGLIVLGVGGGMIGRFVRAHNRAEALAGRNAELYAELLEHRNKLAEENAALISTSNVIVEKMVELSGGREIVYAGPAMTNTVAAIEKASEHSETVLILGESGTGKELAASMIHQKSGRKERPFLAVNCGALPDTLLESELFGHERGAFTGAHQMRRGYFEQAQRGTIFLDEIGEMALPLQVKLLRVLQERTVTRLGGEVSFDVDVRVVAATNRDLASAVEAGEFRADLFYRLNVIQIQMPPLRNRPEDIPLLVAHALRKFADKLGKPDLEIDAAALTLLAARPWPGNVRELENAVLRAAAAGDSSLLTKADFPEPAGTIQRKTDNSGALDQAEQTAIRNALAGNGGNKTAAAKQLGIDRGTLRRKLKRYGMM